MDAEVGGGGEGGNGVGHDRMQHCTKLQTAVQPVQGVKNWRVEMDSRQTHACPPALSRHSFKQRTLIIIYSQRNNLPLMIPVDPRDRPDRHSSPIQCLIVI